MNLSGLGSKESKQEVFGELIREGYIKDIMVYYKEFGFDNIDEFIEIIIKDTKKGFSYIFRRNFIVMMDLLSEEGKDLNYIMSGKLNIETIAKNMEYLLSKGLILDKIFINNLVNSLDYGDVDNLFKILSKVTGVVDESIIIQLLAEKRLLNTYLESNYNFLPVINRGILWKIIGFFDNFEDLLKYSHRFELSCFDAELFKFMLKKGVLVTKYKDLFIKNIVFDEKIVQKLYEDDLLNDDILHMFNISDELKFRYRVEGIVKHGDYLRIAFGDYNNLIRYIDNLKDAHELKSILQKSEYFNNLSRLEKLYQLLQNNYDLGVKFLRDINAIEKDVKDETLRNLFYDCYDSSNHNYLSKNIIEMITHQLNIIPDRGIINWLMRKELIAGESIKEYLIILKQLNDNGFIRFLYFYNNDINYFKKALNLSTILKETDSFSLFKYLIKTDNFEEYIKVIQRHKEKGSDISNFSNYMLDLLFRLGDVNKFEKGILLYERLQNSKSTEVIKLADSIFDNVLDLEDPVKAIDTIEKVFVRNGIPSVGKLMRVFEQLYSDTKINALMKLHMSPVLVNQLSNNVRRFIMYRDLLKSHLLSGEQSMRNYLEVLQSGDKLIEKYESGAKLSQEESQQLLYTLSKLNALGDNKTIKITSLEKYAELSSDIDTSLEQIKTSFGLKKDQKLMERVSDMFLKPIDYLIFKGEPQNLEQVFFHIAKSGVYTPIIDKNGKIIFTPVDFDNFRKTVFSGVGQYGSGKIDIVQTQSEKFRNMILTNTPTNGEKESLDNVRNNILSLVGKGLSNIGMRLKPSQIETSIDFIEISDTGSTSRNTNLVGGYDFDFGAKLNETDFRKLPNIITELQNQFHAESFSRTITQNDYVQYVIKGALVNGERIDIDIGFTKYKTGSILDTNRSLELRLDAIRKQYGEEGLNEVIANIRTAKQILKDAECYKKGIHGQGGLGGIGIETWILNNGGNIEIAFRNFYSEAFNDGKIVPFSEFKQNYKIYSAGENLRSTQIGNFVDNMTEEGYKKIVEVIGRYLNE